MSTADKRAAALKARRSQLVDSPKAPVDTATEAARAHFMGTSAVEALSQGQIVRALPVGQIAPELRPHLRQPRLLPLPEELRPDGVWNEAERSLINELLTLGESLRERQIQPIVVHVGVSERYLEAQYLIVVGHRRWTAARLIGLPTIDAVVIDQPSSEDLIAMQFSENEDRAEFCDMERAWALERMRQLMPDVPWEAIETRFRLSESRRKQLIRLTAFTPEQQRSIARLRASEFQLRPLHTAIREGKLAPVQADRIFAQLVRRVASQMLPANGSGTQSAQPVMQPFDQSFVARLIARTQQDDTLPAPSSHPRWLAPLQQHMQQARVGLERASARVADLDDTALAALQLEVGALLTALETMVGTLAVREHGHVDADS